VASRVDPAAAVPSGAGTGDPFGRYRLVELIGKGGMAEVYLAISDGLAQFQRTFVIKRIRPDRSDSPKFVQMFCDEARISALLHHPNIVQVYDFGQIDGAYFMAMEHLRGKDLASVLRALRAQRATMPASLAATIVRDVARALHHAHTALMPDGEPCDIVHRDVTPSNIMLLWAGGVKILDFGIAKAAALARPSEAAPREAGKLPRLQGKLAYLSPEQIRGAEVDRRSDLFSLGVVLWEMVAGQRLFAGADEYETMRNVLMQAVAPPSRRRGGIPAGLDAVVAHALARERERRYQTADEMADDLDAVLREMSAAGQGITHLLHHLFGRDPKPGGQSVGPDEAPSHTISATGTAGPDGGTPLPMTATHPRRFHRFALFALVAGAIVAAAISALAATLLR
jgi:eukaryotic-like serine/threonine-protein kinase